MVPNVAKWSAIGLLVIDLSEIDLLVIDSLKTGPSVIGPSGTGLNDHELVHEVERTVGEPAVGNHEVAEQASWAAEFF